MHSPAEETWDIEITGKTKPVRFKIEEMYGNTAIFFCYWCEGILSPFTNRLFWGLSGSLFNLL